MLLLEFNFIADYNHNTMIYLGDLPFYVDPKSENIKPHFIHIYHDWGNNDLDAWRDVYTFINS